MLILILFHLNLCNTIDLKILRKDASLSGARRREQNTHSKIFAFN